MMDPDNIEDFYRQAVEGLNEDPGPAAWERIADDLDVRDVWTRLESSLDKRDRKVIFFRRLQIGVAAALIPLFLTFIGFQIFKGTEKGNAAGGNFLSGIDLNHQEYLAQASQELSPNNNSDEKESDPGSNAALFASSDEKANGDTEGIEQNTQPSNEGVSSPLSGNPAEKFAVARDKQLEPTFKVSREWIDAANLKEYEGYAVVFELAEGKRRTEDDMYPGFKDALSVDQLDPGPDKKGDNVFALGAISGVKNQWMLSPSTVSSFKKSNDDYTELTFSGSAGLSASMEISDKFDVQSDLMLFSRNGQKQVEYLKGRTVDSEVDLGYSKLLVMTKWKNARIKLFDKPLVGALVGGMYGAYLVSQERTLSYGDNTYKTSPQDYRNTDFGLVGGYELNYLLSEHFELAPGIRYQQGLVNIFRGTEATPSQLNNTLNTSFEFNVGFRYRFGSVKKEWK